MPVYKFTDRSTGKARIVLANNQAQGLRHVAESAFDVSIVRSQQLAAIVTRPGAPTIERAEGYKDTGPETQDLPLSEPSTPREPSVPDEYFARMGPESSP